MWAKSESGQAKGTRYQAPPDPATQRAGECRRVRECRRAQNKGRTRHYSTRPAKPDRASTSSISCGTERATSGECTNTARH